MLSMVRISGYKSIDDVSLNLNNFTLLSGVNSAGKSSVIQGILYAAKAGRILKNPERRSLFYDGGKFSNIRNNIKGNKVIEISLKMSSQTEENEIDVRVSSEDNDALRWDFKIQPPEADYFESHQMIYLPVERVGICKTYELDVAEGRRIGEGGKYVYSYLAQNGQESISERAFAYQPEQIGMSLNNQVNYWLSYLVGFRIRTAIISEADQVVVTYANAESNRYYRASSVGAGVVYVSSLIIAALSCKTGDTFIIENPEIHLHPRAQSKFMEFLAYLSERGLQVIIETHSDHIYNGVRKCVKKQSLDREKTAIYYFELDETMQTRVQQIYLNAQGAEENHPYGMFDQFDDDLDELLDM